MTQKRVRYISAVPSRAKVRTSTKRLELMELVSEYHDEHKYCPSLRDIMDALHISSTSVVRYYLDDLRLKGYIDWLDGQSRTVHLTMLGENFLSNHKFPGFPVSNKKVASSQTARAFNS